MDKRTHLLTDVIAQDRLVLVATDLTNEHSKYEKLFIDLKNYVPKN